MSKTTDALRDARIAAGLTQRDLALALGVSAGFLNDIEHGRRPLARHHFTKLPKAIRVRVIDAEIDELQASIAELRELRRQP